MKSIWFRHFRSEFILPVWECYLKFIEECQESVLREFLMVPRRLISQSIIPRWRLTRKVKTSILNVIFVFCYDLTSSHVIRMCVLNRGRGKMNTIFICGEKGNTNFHHRFKMQQKSLQYQGEGKSASALRSNLYSGYMK